MSWTRELTESEEFKVKHTKEVRSMLEEMGFIVYTENNKISFTSSSEEGTWFDDNAEVVLSINPKEGKNYVGLISDYIDKFLEEVLEENGLEESDVVIQNVVEYLQDELVNEKEYIAIKWGGYEGRSGGNSNPFGGAMFITKTSVDYVDTNQFVYSKVKLLRGEE